MWNCNVNADHEELLIPAPRFHGSAAFLRIPVKNN